MEETESSSSSLPQPSSSSEEEQANATEAVVADEQNTAEAEELTDNSNENVNTSENAKESIVEQEPNSSSAANLETEITKRQESTGDSVVETSVIEAAAETAPQEESTIVGGQEGFDSFGDEDDFSVASEETVLKLKINAIKEEKLRRRVFVSPFIDEMFADVFIVMTLVQFLGNRDIVQVALVNKKLAQAVLGNEAIWKGMCKQRWIQKHLRTIWRFVTPKSVDHLFESVHTPASKNQHFANLGRLGWKELFMLDVKCEKYIAGEYKCSLPSVNNTGATADYRCFIDCAYLPFNIDVDAYWYELAFKHYNIVQPGLKICPTCCTAYANYKEVPMNCDSCGIPLKPLDNIMKVKVNDRNSPFALPLCSGMLLTQRKDNNEQQRRQVETFSRGYWIYDSERDGNGFLVTCVELWKHEIEILDSANTSRLKLRSRETKSTTTVKTEVLASKDIVMKDATNNVYKKATYINAKEMEYKVITEEELKSKILKDVVRKRRSTGADMSATTTDSNCIVM